MATTGHHDRFLRALISVVVVAVTFLVIPHTPLEGPVGGVIAIAIVVICSWHGGAVPAACLPLLVLVISRFSSTTPKPLVPTSRELMTFLMLTVLTTSLGLAGAYRRRWRATTDQHQRRLREHARALSAARIIVCDLDNRIISWSEGAEALFGWTASEAVGRQVCELLQTQFSCPRNEVLAELLQRKQWQGEVHQRHRNGSDLQVQLHSIVSEEDDGTATGIVHVSTDVTALRLAENVARDAERRKDLFLAVLAHELRNPLAPLRSGIYLLDMSRDLSSDDRETLGIMQRQLEHMVRLIDDLMDVSRINSGKIHLQRATVPLAPIVQNAIECVRPRMMSSEHEFQADLTDQAVWVHGDAARLTQIVANLLNNAAKFTPPKGRISLHVTQDDGHAVIRVGDSGVGISSTLLPKVFEMFTQSEDLTKRSQDGLGIGLCIVKTVVEMHGGSVDAHSAGLSQGSTFTVRIPLVMPAVSVDAPMTDADADSAPHNGRHHRSSLTSGA